MTLAIPTIPSPNLAVVLQDYADAGYFLTSLNGKIPGKGWRKTAYNPFPRIADFPSGNFGVVLQDGDLVIDVDPRNFKDGIDSWKALRSELKLEIPDLQTCMVRTGSGGLHIYFKKPAELAVFGALKGFPGIEFKTTGQQVVGAGSIHPDTEKLYVFAYQNIGRVIDAPKCLLDLIERREVKHSSTGIIDYVDDEQTKSRYKQYLATAPVAIEGENGDRTTFAVAAVGHDFGLHPDITFGLMLQTYNVRCEPPWTPDDLRTKVYNAYKYSASAIGNVSAQAAFEIIPAQNFDQIAWDRYADGRFRATMKNTANMFLHRDSPLEGLLAFNEFTADIVFRRNAPWHKKSERPTIWNDEEALRCKLYMATQWAFEPKTQDLHDAAVVVAKNYAYHPVKVYLESLKWDGHKRVFDWMTNYLNVADDLYARTVGMKFLVAAVARIYQPGIKFDYMPVLEGPQGIGKSTLCSILAGQWFSDQSLDVHSRDTVDAMRGKWIIEVSEMETHRKAEETAMKAFLSRQTDRARLAYARTTKDFDRQCIFIGTINPDADPDAGYLKGDQNRRYWPIRLGEVNLEALRTIRDQLWAEAVELYKKGVPIYIEDAEVIKLAIIEQTKRLGIDPWQARVAHWVDSDPVYKDKQIITSAEIYCDCLGGEMRAFTRRETTRIASLMRHLKWTAGAFYSPETRLATRGYQRPAPTGVE